MPSETNHVVATPWVLPIGACRRCCRSSTIDHDRLPTPIPVTCRFVMIGCPSFTIEKATNKESTVQKLSQSITTTATLSPPVWYLCRMIRVSNDRIIHHATTATTSIIDNDRPNDDDASCEYFECALSIALIGYNVTASSSSPRTTWYGHHGNRDSTPPPPPKLIPAIRITSSDTPANDENHNDDILETLMIHRDESHHPTTTKSVHQQLAIQNHDGTCTTTSANNNDNFHLYPLLHATTPIPLSSVCLTYTGTLLSSSSSSSCSTVLSNQPLLQSCLKRQFVGCHVGIWNTTKKIKGKLVPTTRVQLTWDQIRWTFWVDSVTAATPRTITTSSMATTTSNVMNHDMDDFDIGVILPSTRITFFHPITTTTTTNTVRTLVPSSELLSHSDVYQSPAVRMLLDTVHCINHIQHMSSSSSSTSSSLPIVGDIPRAFLLSGPPGVGKTHAIRTVVDMISAAKRGGSTMEFQSPSCQLVSLQGSEILAMGQQYSDAAKALERYFLDSIQQMRNSTNITILFLDECDALLGSNNMSSTSLIIESTLGLLLDKMNNVSISSGGDPACLRLIVVAATNRVDAIPSSLRRPGRLDREIPMAPPNASTRLQILESLLASQEVIDHSNVEDHRPSPSELRDIADLCVGFVPADLAAVVRKVELLRIVQTQETFDMNSDATTKESESLFDLWTQAISEVGASALRDAALTAPPTTKWNDVAGDPGGAKTTLRQAIEWPRTKRVAYERLGLTPPRGILLHGPPGCAKTTLARAAAGASAVSFLSLSPADVYSTSYVGDAEAVIRRAFTLARSASPCVLFFDEIDAILGIDENHSSGMGRGSAVEARVLSTFLNEMDGVDGSWKDGVLVLGATNRPWTLDTALLRPGRFDKVIYVPPPDFDGRREIISMHCQHWSKYIIEGSTIDMDYLASDLISGNMTGAEIVGACREAAMFCFRAATTKVTDDSSTLPLIMKQEYLETALNNVRPLLSNMSIMKDFESFQIERTRQVGS